MKSVENSFYSKIPFVNRPTGSLTMDIFVPKSDQKVPVIIWLIGSGWRDFFNFMYEPPLIDLMECGYALAKIQYRMSYEAVFPAQIQDARAGVRFLRKYGAEIGIDVDRIAACGESAGAHLSLLLGLASNEKSFDDDEYSGISAKVSAVCEFYGPSDLTGFKKVKSDDSGYLRDLLGGELKDKMELAKSASPISYIGSGREIPYRIFHGRKDAQVPYEQSVELFNAMKNAGYDVEFTLNEEYGHQILIYPVVRDNLIDFFDKHLKGAHRN